jgi:hypothetical protein
MPALLQSPLGKYVERILELRGLVAVLFKNVLADVSAEIRPSIADEPDVTAF